MVMQIKLLVVVLRFSNVHNINTSWTKYQKKIKNPFFFDGSTSRFKGLEATNQQMNTKPVRYESEVLLRG